MLGLQANSTLFALFTFPGKEIEKDHFSALLHFYI